MDRLLNKAQKIAKSKNSRYVARKNPRFIKQNYSNMVTCIQTKNR